MFRFVTAIALFITLITAAPLLAQTLPTAQDQQDQQDQKNQQAADNCPAKLSQSTIVRNGTLFITVATPPKVKEGTVQLRGPRTFSQTVPLKDDTLEYTIPEQVPLGQYSVTVKLGNLFFYPCELLSVAPFLNWDPKLAPFDPPATDVTKKVRLPGVKKEGRTLRSLTLHGSGFITESPADNEILINGEAMRLKDPGDKTAPTATEVRGKVLNSERIDLYDVPVPPDGLLRLAVRQGSKTTADQPFTVYRMSKLPVALASALIAIALALLVLMLVKIYIHAQPGKTDFNALQVLFLEPETDTYSLSKFQFYIWTATALFGYCYLVISRILVQGESWPDMPEGLPGIIAIGAGTSVGAQVVSNLRGPKGSGAESPSLGDFVTSGGVAAADRVQMLVWTILGAGVFCLSVLKYPPGVIQNLDPVPAGMLSIMGLSAAGYLGGKFARKPGPVINEISISPAVGDDALAAAAAPPPPPPPNLSQPVARAQAVLQGFGTVPLDAETAANALSTAIAEAAKAKTPADAGALVSKLSELKAKAELAAKSTADAFSKAGAPAEAARAAEIAQEAAAALQDLGATVASLVSAARVPALAAPAAASFTRVIELRGRNLSSEALLEINHSQLPIRMLKKQADGTRSPEVLIRDQEVPTLARALRLTLEPAELEGPDYQTYKSWFGNSDESKSLTFTLINPDGQKSDISFTVPPAASQSNVKTGQESPPPEAKGEEGEEPQ